jgi:sterol desaturase/sphingolipid hydroxylase (fatty acid hydroxylase superfamily)
MEYVIAYFVMGVVWTLFRWSHIVGSVEKNVQFQQFRRENPARWRSVRRITVMLGVLVNVVLWPVVMMGDVFWRDKDE